MQFRVRTYVSIYAQSNQLPHVMCRHEGSLGVDFIIIIFAAGLLDLARNLSPRLNNASCVYGGMYLSENRILQVIDNY